MGIITNNDIIDKIMSSQLSEAVKNDLASVCKGESLPQLTSDTVAKKMFSPDVHRERYEYLMRRIMKDTDIAVKSSSANELFFTSVDAKKIITDIPAWLKDGRLADLEVQVAAQSFIDTRVDIYSSAMLMVQYGVDKNQSRSNIDYNNLKDVIVVVLMRHSPSIFKQYSPNKYIHRFTSMKADTGLRLNTSRKIAYVELDKALDVFRGGTYNEDEDKELLLWLATIADVNDPLVSEKAVQDKSLIELRDELCRFAQDKEVQAMLLADQFAQADFNTAINTIRQEEKRRFNEARERYIKQLLENGTATTTEEAEQMADKIFV